MKKRGEKGKNNIIGFRRIRTVTSTKMCEMKICLLAPTQNLLLLFCSESSCAQRWFVLRLKKKENLRKQFGNCAVSLKLAGSLCRGWMKRALIQKKGEVSLQNIHKTPFRVKKNTLIIKIILLLNGAF